MCCNLIHVADILRPCITNQSYPKLCQSDTALFYHWLNQLYMIEQPAKVSFEPIIEGIWCVVDSRPAVCVGRVQYFTPTSYSGTALHTHAYPNTKTPCQQHSLHSETLTLLVTVCRGDQVSASAIKISASEKRSERLSNDITSLAIRVDLVRNP